MHTAIWRSFFSGSRNASARNHSVLYTAGRPHFTSSMSAQLDHTCAVALCIQQDGSRVSISGGLYVEARAAERVRRVS